MISKSIDPRTGEGFTITDPGGKERFKASRGKKPKKTPAQIIDQKITNKNKSRAARRQQRLPMSTTSKKRSLRRKATGSKQNPQFAAHNNIGSTPIHSNLPPKKKKATPAPTPPKQPFMATSSRRFHARSGGTTVTTQPATSTKYQPKGPTVSATTPPAPAAKKKGKVRTKLSRAGDAIRRHVPDSQTIGYGLDELSHTTGARTAAEGGKVGPGSTGYIDPAKVPMQGKAGDKARAEAMRNNAKLREPTSAKSGPQNVRRLAGAAKHYDITPGKAARAAFGPQGRRIAGGVVAGTAGAVGAIKGRKKRAAEQAVKDKPWKALPKLKGKTGMVLGAGTATAALGAGAVKVNETQQKRKQLSNDLKWN